MSIHILPSEVVDQIAAGEVVERPSHMVKELVENSLDAGATQVHVEWSLGGREVRIIDNGSGIPSDELALALDRHATSKISTSDDLWKLSSFGFRGEALASIAAVSLLTLKSRTAKADSAFQIVSEYGKKNPIEACSGNPGTTIYIQNLFQNTPARLKFLKTDAAESAQIKTTLKALALAYPATEFRAVENGKLIFYYPIAKSKKERAEQVLEVKPLYEASAVRDSVRATAVFADPHHVGKTARNIWLFAQNRWIQDRSLQVACLEAYRNLLMHGEYPICAVWVETEPENIDVNIHPTKSQVKFQDPSLAFRAVQGSLRDGLEKAPWIEKGNFADPGRMDLDSSHGPGNSFSQLQNHSMPSSSATQMPTENLKFSDEQMDKTQFQKKFYQTQNSSQPSSYFSTPRSHTSVENLSTPMSAFAALNVKTLDGVNSNSHTSSNSESNPEKSTGNSYQGNSNLSNAWANIHEAKGYWSSLEVIGQAHLTYIVCQTRDKMVFVDQHAAHERVGFERLMSAWRGGKIDVQDFLFPLALDLSPEKVEAVLTVQKDLEKLGIHLEQLGPGTLGVKAAPLMLKESVFGDVFEKMSLEILEHGGSFHLEKIIGDICATMACHSVVRAGQSLSLEQMRNLLSEMDDFPLSSFCPHGRPVSVDYPIYKLEKDFGRIV